MRTKAQRSAAAIRASESARANRNHAQSYVEHAARVAQVTDAQRDAMNAQEARNTESAAAEAGALTGATFRGTRRAR
jgi:hypothetical protein